MYEEHRDKPDRFFHTTPAPQFQLEMDLATTASEQRIDRYLESVNAALERCTIQQAWVWRACKGIAEDGSLSRPIPEHQVAALIGVAKQTVRASFLEAEARVKDEIASRALELAGVPGLVQRGRRRRNEDRTRREALNGAEALGEDESWNPDAAAVDAIQVQPTQVRRHTTHGCDLPCDRGMPSATTIGAELVAYHERMLARTT